MSTEFTRDAKDELFGHPKGLYVCFFTEMWERFSFYGMKFLLVLYVTKYHLFTDEMGLQTLGAYAGLAYTFPLIGGMLADRYLGEKKAILWGGILLVMGHFLMAFEGTKAHVDAAGVIVRDTVALDVFYLALSLIIIGVGFLKPNVSTVVGRLYKDGDPRRDSGFTIFYMGINIGSVLATLICTYLGETYGWKYGFGAAGIGMLVGLVMWMAGQKYLHGESEPKNPGVLKESFLGPINKEWAIYLGSFFIVAFVWLIVKREPWVLATQYTLLTLSVGGTMIYAFMKTDKVTRDRLIALMIMIVSTIIFWALFEQAGASMTLFADRVVDRNIMGLNPTAGQFGSLNAAFIVILAPVFAWMWMKLDKMNLDPSIPMKFAIGLIQAGLGFGVLVYGSQHPNELGQVGAIWLILAYLLHTTGELALSPVGLSAVTKLSPKHMVGFVMGTWFLATAFSETLAARLSQMAAIDITTGETATIAEQAAKYSELFYFLFKLGIGAGIVSILLTPVLKKMMHGIK